MTTYRAAGILSGFERSEAGLRPENCGQFYDQVPLQVILALDCSYGAPV
jgi:hypothetical protein